MLTKFRQSIGLTTAISGVFALLIITGVMIAYQITPFGRQNLLFSDNAAQYVTFLTALRHALVTHQFSLYSFGLSLGSNAVPTLAYYLMSPFNLGLVFFSAAQVPSAITLMIILKVACISAAMAYFLQRHFEIVSGWAVLFGAAFGLCGFVAADYFDIMWLDSLICLPLIINGLDTIVRGGKPTRFFVWLLFGVIVNYYLGYMICIFIVCYTVYIIYEDGHGQLSFSQLLKQNKDHLLTIIFSGFFSLMSAMVILVPTVIGMMQTAKHAYVSANFTFRSMFIFSVLAQLGIGGVSYGNHLIHAPAIFSSLIVTLLVGCYFVHPNISRSSKWHATIFLLGLLLSMKVCITNTIWHLFQQPSGFPFRQAFFFSFMMITISYGAWLKNAKLVSRHWKVALPAIIMGCLILGTFGPHFLMMSSASNRLSSTQLDILTLNLTVIVLGSLIIFTTGRLLQACFMIGLFAGELSGNFLIAMAGSPFGNQIQYQQRYQREAAILKAITKDSGQLYRTNNQSRLINNSFQRYYNYNDALLFNYRGISEYNSTINDTTRRTLNSLGLFSKNVRRISAQGLNPVTEMLLGVKYNVSPSNRLTQNTSYVGMGFPTSKSLTTIQLHPTDKFTNLEKILVSINKGEAPYFYPVRKTRVQLVRNKSKQTNYRYHLQMTVNTTGPLYLNARLRGTNYTTITVNGKHIASPKVTANRFRFLDRLGSYTKGTKLSVALTSTIPYPKALQFESMNQWKFKKLVASLQFPGYVPKIQGNQISGDIIANRHQRSAFLSIPFDKGWQIKLNGQPTAPGKVLNGLMAVPIKSGLNYIVLTYHTPGLTIGSIFSILGLVSFICLSMVLKLKEPLKHRKKS